MKAGPLRAAACALVLTLAAGACGGGGGSTTTVDAAAGGGAAARSFEATTLDGEAVALADYAGQDIMVWFWAPW